MTTEELMKERYKVIANYPGCKFKVGDILTYVREIAQTYDLWRNEATGVEITYSGFGAYPHLFEPLPWWKERKAEDMPRYLKDTRDGEVVSAIQYGNSQVLVMARVFQCRIELRYLIPCDEADYNAYLQTTNQNNGQ
jgi:hypothetical protein